MVAVVVVLEEEEEEEEESDDDIDNDEMMIMGCMMNKMNFFLISTNKFAFFVTMMHLVDDTRSVTLVHMFLI